MTVVGQVLQQTSELDQIMQAAFSAQGRVLIAQRAEPAQEMGVTAQLRELAHFGERRVEIGEEAVGCASIVVQCSPHANQSAMVCKADRRKKKAGEESRLRNQRRRVEGSGTRSGSLRGGAALSRDLCAAE